MKRFINVWNRTSLIKRIIIGVILGFILGMTLPKVSAIGILGDLFVGGLKAVAHYLSLFWLLAHCHKMKRDKRPICQRLLDFILLGP